MNLLFVIFETAGLAIAFIIGIVTIKKYVSEPILKQVIGESYYKTIQGLFIFIIQAVLYLIIRKYAFNLSPLSKGVGLFFLFGALLGSVMILFSALVLKALKAYNFQKNPEFSARIIFNIITGVVFFLVLAFFEEIVFRGILYTGLRSDIGFAGTMIITMLIFFVSHLKNDGINVFSIISLLLAGVLLNILREYSQDIWMPFGFHFAWNFYQGFIGFNVSGDNEMIPIYKVTTAGKRYLDGGKFGIEASVVTIFILAISIFVLVIFINL